MNENNDALNEARNRWDGIIAVLCNCGARVEIPIRLEGQKKEIRYKTEVKCQERGRRIYHFWNRCPDCNRYIVMSACEAEPGGSLVTHDV